MSEQQQIDEILETLNKLKTELEDYNLRREEGHTDLQWEDLD